MISLTLELRVLFTGVATAALMLTLWYSPNRDRYVEKIRPSSWIDSVREMDRHAWVVFLVAGFGVMILGLFTRPIVSSFVQQSAGATVNQSSNSVKNVASVSIPLLVFLGGALPILEEWLCREVVLNEVARESGSKIMGVLGGAGVFGSLHMLNEGFYLPGVVPMTYLGVLFGVAYIYGGLKASALAHGGMNVAVALLWFYV